MILARALALTALLAAFSVSVALPVAAQPMLLQGSRLPIGSEAPPANFPLDPTQPGAPTLSQPPALRPVPAKTPSEDTILNRDLKLRGEAGSLRVERAGKTDLNVKLVLPGTRLSRPGEACTVTAAATVPMTARSRTDGLLRYEIQTPSCPLSADLLDGALWVRDGGVCVVEAEDCRADPRGLWGPTPSQLVAQARAIESDRGQADRAVRENYKVLTARARPQDSRSIVSEQAAFSSEREMLCRSYSRESSHGFCNARFSEARAAQLAARLGIGAAASAPSRRATPARPSAPRSTGSE